MEKQELARKSDHLTTSISQFLTKNDQIGLYDAIQGVTLSEAIRSGRSFNQSIKIDGRNKSDYIKLISGVLMKMVNAAYNLQQPLTALQASMMANRLMDYQEMSLEETLVLIRMGIAGTFGPIYGKFDMDTWGQWVDKYMDYRIDEHERQKQQEKQNTGNPARESRVIGVGKEMFQKIVPDEKFFTGPKNNK